MQIIVQFVIQAASALGITEAVLKTLAGGLAIVATYYIGKSLRKWLQAYRDQRQKSEIEGARQGSQAANQKANTESDKLKQIDGR